MSHASVRIDLNALEGNYRAIRTSIPDGVRMLCVVKADAYGHGAVPVARRLQAIGADYLGVATIEEGVELRDHSIRTPILVMGGIMPWDETQSFWEHELTPVLADLDSLRRLATDAERRGAAIRVHVKVDTGMGRLGIGLGELEAVTAVLRTARQIQVEGLMSHFASSEQRDAYGMTQIERFTLAMDYLNRQGIVPTLPHMANSGAVCQYPEAYFGMVRVGIMLYGAYPDVGLADKIKVSPVMKLASRIAYVKTFPTGSPLSYGRTFVTDRVMSVACVALGYGDGFPRVLSNKGSVLIRGSRCAIVGRICMDWLLADVTELPEVAPGEDAIFIGESGNERITADEIAERAGTIPYEIFCNVSKRIPRSYV